jgi:hypothetical protein
MQYRNIILLASGSAAAIDGEIARLSFRTTAHSAPPRASHRAPHTNTPRSPARGAAHLHLSTHRHAAGAGAGARGIESSPYARRSCARCFSGRRACQPPFRCSPHPRTLGFAPRHFHALHMAFAPQQHACTRCGTRARSHAQAHTPNRKLSHTSASRLATAGSLAEVHPPAHTHTHVR